MRFTVINMRSSVLLALTTLLLAAFVSTTQAAQVAHSANVEAQLIPEHSSIAAGNKTTIALRLRMAPEWHTYWRNPGDSGLPTSISWKFPDGADWKPGALQFPTPKALPLAPLMNYGFDQEVWLLTDVVVPASFTAGQTASIAAHVEWLECREVCLPGRADLDLSLPVAAEAVADPQWRTDFGRWRSALPQPLPPGARVTAEAADGRITIMAAGALPAAAQQAHAYFFPLNEGLVEYAAPQTLTREGANATLELHVARQLAAKDADRTTLRGMLTWEERGNATVHAYAIETPLVGSLVAGKWQAPNEAPRLDLGQPDAEPAKAGPSFGPALLFALIGGLILNLMPCVFPLLSIKVLGFARHAGQDGRSLRFHGLAFGLGVVLSFLLLAGLLISLRAAGEAIGWGFQLQNPVVVTGLAVLFFLLGLNLSGVFEFHVAADGDVPSHHPLFNAFASGVLAVAVASPCTAPLMGAALGYALTQPAAVSLSVFAALGLGMALPVVLLSWFPRWLAHLPRPGPWLAHFKQFLAFPLYATVVWLAWVLGMQTGVDQVVRLGAVLVAAALAAWLFGLSQSGRRRGMSGLLALLAGGASILLAAPLLHASATTAVSTAPKSTEWEPWSKARVEELNAQGKTVFVDFTAAWCVTCQANKRLVLETDAVRRGFAEKGIVLLRADWTRRDETIAAALAELGRSGVPVYVLYRPGSAPQLLPELLTQQTVLGAL